MDFALATCRFSYGRVACVPAPYADPVAPPRLLGPVARADRPAAASLARIARSHSAASRRRPRRLLLSRPVSSSRGRRRQRHLWLDRRGGRRMSGVDPRRRLLAVCDDELATQHEDHDDHVYDYDAPRIGPSAEQRSMRRNIGFGSARQERNQANGNRPGISMRRWRVRFGQCRDQ